jgi:nitroimidazol reductase NimA-like FMN-containing flavoprotein (pyridoxamine 5'-phosphate oxidase superfamily)
MARMGEHQRPVFRDLERDEIDAVLARNHVGRIAYAFHDHVDIEPINYAYEDGWVYGRTGPGTKLLTLEHHPWVAFEVDEISGLFDWTSVVAHGAFYLIEGDGTPREREQEAHAIELLRLIVPETLADGDPTPYRTALFRVHLDRLRGRTARSGRRGGTPRDVRRVT